MIFNTLVFHSQKFNNSRTWIPEPSVTCIHQTRLFVITFCNYNIMCCPVPDTSTSATIYRIDNFYYVSIRTCNSFIIEFVDCDYKSCKYSNSDISGFFSNKPSQDLKLKPSAEFRKKSGKYLKVNH